MSSLDRRSSLSILGLGYVGNVSAACFASRGHRVVGVDVDARKLELLGRGVAPIVEETIADLTREVTNAGLLTVNPDARQAVLDTDITLVCVGTPSAPSGAVNTSFLESVTREIAEALRAKQEWHTVVYRSTMPPGTCEGSLIPILESLSGLTAGVDFGVCVNPEFLREGSSVSDFFNPSKTVVGATDERAEGAVAALYDGLPGQLFRVPVRVAEMIKYVDNSFHALKVDFGNEIGALCAELGMDSYDVIDVFLSDTKLNVSPAYLRPGFAFGGSCLPKDVRALLYIARQNDVDLPLLSSILPSNHAHAERALAHVVALGRCRVGLLGLAFKGGTDDLRESPMVELAERLIGKGFDVKIYDPSVALSRLMGSNRTYIDEHLPHLAELLVSDPVTVVEESDVVVAAAHDEAALAAIDKAAGDVAVLDLVRLPEADRRRDSVGYRGIAW